MLLFRSYEILSRYLFLIPRYLSWYSDWLHAGRYTDRMPVGRDFLQDSPLALETTQPPTQWVRTHFPGDKAAGAWLLLTTLH